MALQEDLIRIEEELWAGDAAVFRRHLDDDCMIAFTQMAGVMTRDQVAGTVEGAPRWRDLSIVPVGLIRPVDGVAILTYRASATREGAGRYEALISSAYVRREDAWKMAFHQQTPLPAGEAPAS